MLRQRIVFVAMWAFLLVMEIMLELHIFAVLRYSLVLLLLISGSFLLVQKRKLLVFFTEKSFRENVKEPMGIRFYLKNESAFPVSRMKIELAQVMYFAGERHVCEIVTGIGGRQERKLELGIELKHAGRVDMRIQRIVLYDWLGCFSCHIKSNEQAVIAVYPQPRMAPIPIDVICQNHYEENDFFLENETGDMPPELLDIRPFRAGDRLQKIHWKLSVKKDEWFVKEFAAPEMKYVVVFFDYFVQTLEASDELYVRLLSSCIQIMDEKLQAFIIWFDEAAGKFVRHRISSMEDIYRTMDGACLLIPQKQSYFADYEKNRPHQSVILISK